MSDFQINKSWCDAYNYGETLRMPMASGDKADFIITSRSSIHMTIARWNYWRFIWSRAVLLFQKVKCRIGAHEMLGEADFVDGKLVYGSRMRCMWCAYTRGPSDVKNSL